MDAMRGPTVKARALALQRVANALDVFRRYKRARARLLKQGPTDLAVRRANHEIWLSASLLVGTVEAFRPVLGSIYAKRALAGVLDIPPPKYCECGCREFVWVSNRGRPPRFATAACRKRAYRRRQVGLPENAPKAKLGGRAPLVARLQDWLLSRDLMRSIFIHNPQAIRDGAREARHLTRGQLRNYLKALRIEAGLRPSPLSNIRASRYSTRSLQI